jgi:antitoxin component YwqK of YwqJK toxin-antitoxin module
MRLPRLLFFVGCACLLGACAGSHATTSHEPRGFWRPNRSDRNGRAQGRWRTYYDEANTQPFTAGRYRHGRPVRTFYYYAPTGALDHSERYQREGFCEVTYWYPDGKVARRGPAQWVTGKGKAPRFYWYGTWTSYAENGQTTGVQTYTNGSLTRAETYVGGQLNRAENYQSNGQTRVETYGQGKLMRVETYENGRLVSSTDTL